MEERSRSAQVAVVLLVYPPLGVGIFIALLLLVPGFERWLDDGDATRAWLFFVGPGVIGAAIAAAAMRRDRTRHAPAIVGLSLLAGLLATTVYGAVAIWVVANSSS